MWHLQHTGSGAKSVVDVSRLRMHERKQGKRLGTNAAIDAETEVASKMVGETFAKTANLSYVIIQLCMGLDYGCTVQIVLMKNCVASSPESRE